MQRPFKSNLGIAYQQVKKIKITENRKRGINVIKTSGRPESPITTYAEVTAPNDMDAATKKAKKYFKNRSKLSVSPNG